MDLTLDYNIELYPLKQGENFSLALASSLLRNGASGAGDADDDDKDQYIWRPDGKGRRGLEEDYEYVMYGKVSCTFILCKGQESLTIRGYQVYKFDGGTAEIVQV